MSEIEPRNIAAQLAYRGRGNPPSTHPQSAIANCFPGLEFDFRNLWRRIFVGIELHEASNVLMRVDPNSAAGQAGVTTDHILVSVADLRIARPGVPIDRGRNFDWTNLLATVVGMAPKPVKCEFGVPGSQQTISVMLPVRSLFDGIAIARDAAEPGALTQSLCSPWQADYRECACFYWAASRPDFVNVEVDGDEVHGHNWIQKQRGPATPREYLPDDLVDARFVSYDDLYQNWERELKFVVGGQDAE
jgi:hypothetical protein